MSEPRWILELLGEESGDAARSVELPLTGTLVLGCSRERAGFVLDGQGVDEAHCAIGHTKEGDWAVKDLGSRHGTMLNGQRVAAARLKLGDQIVLGSRRLEVRTARDPARVPVGSARPSDVPARIGGYRIERLIGKGAMGAVYLAVQESLRRPVALKVLAPKLAADRDFVHRFQAEARAAAALSHPNVVVVYDVGEENGAHYLSMEFMAGGSLEQKLAASGPLPWKAALTVLGDAAAGLAYAESRGIVHRDIKPANLMYSLTGTVKIADLGLATTIEQEASEAVDGRKVYGTPHFISPEQARGQAVDHRSDLYSLGATAYRLLSGRTPFEGASTREILRALQSEAPRPLHELVPDLPPELEAVIQRLMEKDPAARFPTAETLRRECERLRLVAEHGPAIEVRRGARWQRALALVLLLVVGGAAGAYYLMDRPRDQAPSPAVSERPDPVTPLDEPLDAAFFGGDGGSDEPAADEEALLRAREQEASLALAAVPDYLAGEERTLALERLRDEYAGTAAAAQAEAELATLASGAAPPSAGAPSTSVDDVAAALAREIEALEATDAAPAAVLAAIDAFRPPAEIAAEFEPRRSQLATARIQAAEAEVRERFAQATQLALEGRFDDLRAHLAGLEPAFAGLDEVPGDPARLAGLRALRDDLAARRARVDEEERFYLANVELAQRRAVGEAVGPGSGLLAELGALELDAVEQRLGALAPELRARAPCTLLAEQVRLARTALDVVRAEFAGGGWRRKAVLDPRTKKPREVRDVLPEGLAFDKDGALERVSWRDVKSDPDWWNQLFQARLAREWQADETRAIVALLRLVGATRGAELAREMIDVRGRQTLQPGEIGALAAVFEPALAWAGSDDAELRATLEREKATAQRLARALEAAQGRAWTSAVAHLEFLLGQGGDSLLLVLLSDGADWREAPRAAPPALPSNGPADDR